MSAPRHLPGHITAWASAELARATLRALSPILVENGAQVLVTKGAYLAFAVAPRPGYRVMGDADAVVVAGSFARVAEALRRSPDWVCVADDWSAKMFTRTSNRADLDLHRRPLPPGFGRINLANLLARARDAREIFGPGVLVPDPEDGAAISIGNYVKDRLGAVGHGKLALDLQQLIEHRGLRPFGLAARLAEHGLRRIGLVAFTALCQTDPAWEPWISALDAAPWEKYLAEQAVALSREHAARHPDLGYLALRAIADSAWQAPVGLGLAAVRLGRDRVRRLLPKGRNRRFGGLF